jgi:ribosomal protein L37E
MVTPGKRPRATLHYQQKQIGSIVIQRPGNIIVERNDGRKDRFSSVEHCAFFCGFPTSEKIKLEWQEKPLKMRAA